MSTVHATGEDTTDTVQVHGKGVHIRTWTHPDPSRVVVIAHGYAEHADYWSPIAEVIRERADAEVVALDLPGHGRSEGERGTFTDIGDLVDALAATVDLSRTRRPGIPTVILGHSMGGVVATRYVQTHTEAPDLLILHAAALLPRDVMPDTKAVDGPGAMTQDAGLAAVIANDPLRVNGPMPADTREAMLAGAAAGLDADPLGTVPLVWLHGADDALLPYDAARRSCERLGALRTAFLGYADRGHGGILEAGNEDMLDDLVWFVRTLLRAPVATADAAQPALAGVR